MRKIYTTLFVFAMAGSMAFAQTNAGNEKTSKKMKSDPTFIITNDGVIKPVSNSNETKEAQIIIFEDDFSDTSTWIIDHNEAGYPIDWQIGLNLETSGGAQIESINSTTRDNGYAMIDSDTENNQSGPAEDAWLTMANPVDLTDFDKIVVEFETMYRSWSDETAFLVLSTDPDVWPELVPSTNADDIVGVYKVFPGIPYGSGSASIDNPTTIQINVSDYAANQPEIYVRFSWNGIYGYAWFIDDFKIIDQPANDVKMLMSRLSHNGTGDINDVNNYKLREQYARMPANQVSEFHVGAESFNFGFETQTNIITTLEVRNSADELVFGFTDTEAELVNNDTIFPTDLIPITLENDLYSVNFSVVTDQENDDTEGNFGNNVIMRGLEIGTDYYAADGIGVHPVAQVGSFTVGDDPEAFPEDGYRVLTHYDIGAAIDIHGLEVLLRADATVPGGFLRAAILDSTETMGENFDNPFAESEEIEVTQEDIDNGYLRIYFDDPIIMENAQVYASIEFFVSIDVDNDSPISILDDKTVKQPDLSTNIFVPEDNTVYTNGTCAAIRMMLNGSVGIEEVKEEVAVLSQNVPNPASKLTRIDFELLSNQNVSVIITDIQGKLISNENLGSLPQGAHQYIFDVSNLKAGIYQYTILTENGKLTKTMSVIK